MKQKPVLKLTIKQEPALCILLPLGRGKQHVTQENQSIHCNTGECTYSVQVQFHTFDIMDKYSHNNYILD